MTEEELNQIKAVTYDAAWRGAETSCRAPILAVTDPKIIFSAGF